VQSSFTPRVRQLTEGMATLHTAICHLLIGDFGAIARATAKGTCTISSRLAGYRIFVQNSVLIQFEFSGQMRR
jgi:hypothetical protein